MLLKGLLYPFSLLYSAVMQIRNHLYDTGLRPSAAFDIPVISVGNLTVGGTGKTPMVEYLIRLLHARYKVAVVSRGYGRSTKGFIFADETASASSIGDEPFQYFQKFEGEINVAVGEERALAISLALQEAPDTEIVILDDAFQHRRVKPSLNILLCDYHRPFYDDLVLPAGRLREPSFSASRADLVVVTKCPPDITDEKFIEIERSIRAIAHKPIFFSSISYGIPIGFGMVHRELGDTIILVTGIANAGTLVEYCKAHFQVLEHLSFSDHRVYKLSDIQRLAELSRRHPRASFLTTEKDMVKLNSPEFSSLIRELPVFYLPITVQFLKQGDDFDQLILEHVGHTS